MTTLVPSQLPSDCGSSGRASSGVVRLVGSHRLSVIIATARHKRKAALAARRCADRVTGRTALAGRTRGRLPGTCSAGVPARGHGGGPSGGL